MTRGMAIRGRDSGCWRTWPEAGCRTRLPHWRLALDVRERLEARLQQSCVADHCHRIRDAGNHHRRRWDAVRRVLRADDPVQPAPQVLRRRSPRLLQGDAHAGADARRFALHDDGGEPGWRRLHGRIVGGPRRPAWRRARLSDARRPMTPPASFRSSCR